jgi:hypothetical protein
MEPPPTHSEQPRTGRNQVTDRSAHSDSTSTTSTDSVTANNPPALSLRATMNYASQGTPSSTDLAASERNNAMHILPNVPEAVPSAASQPHVAAHVKAAGASLPVRAGYAKDHCVAASHSLLGPVAATAPVVPQKGIPLAATSKDKGKQDGSYDQGASPPVADVPRQVWCMQTESCVKSLKPLMGLKTK